MGLIDLKTNLKSLKFGNDQQGGGSSNQPYIISSIPEGFSTLNSVDNDFLLRGGITAFSRTADDILRIGKFFTDTNSPSGLLFILKQNLLSRISVKTQYSTGVSYGGAKGGINEGIYNPVNTIFQIASSAFGGHFNKQGLIPNDDPAGQVSIKKYNDVIKYNQPTDNNRLVDFYNKKIIIKTNSPNLYSYGGGPDSILGIGDTNIKIISGEQRTGENNIKSDYLFKKDFRSFYVSSRDITSKRVIPIGSSEKYYNITKDPFFSSINPDFNIVSPNRGFSGPGITVAGRNIDDFLDSLPDIQNPSIFDPKLFESIYSYEGTQNNSVYVSGTLDASEIGRQNNNTLSYPQITTLSNNLGNKNKTGYPSIDDFRKILLQGKTESTINSKSPDYKFNNIESRVNLGGKNNAGPGNSFGKNLISYVSGSGLGPVDKINALPIYQSQGPKRDIGQVDSIFQEWAPVNDLVKFRIASIDGGGSNNKIYMHFRAFLDNISDSYDADWGSLKYLGRGENFYSYNGFDRKISLSWTTYAQSKEELIPMYKKLNYLASNLSPDYSMNGYMRGPLVSLTIGGYIYEQPGFITSLTYDITSDTTWEVGINDTNGFSDSSVKELPHMLKVSSFSFTPIHEFVPRKQTNVYGTYGMTNSWGDQRYISLASGKGEMYNNYTPDTENIS